MKTPFFRTPYNYDTKKVSDDTGYTETMQSLTVQSQAEDADINVIMHRYGITGRLPENPILPTYADFTQITNYQEAMNACMTASKNFLTLPANIRAQFDNDPQRLLEFVEDPRNYEKGVEIGLLKKRAQNDPNVNNNPPPATNTQATGGSAPPNPPAPGGGAPNTSAPQQK